MKNRTSIRNTLHCIAVQRSLVGSILLALVSISPVHAAADSAGKTSSGSGVTAPAASSSTSASTAQEDVAIQLSPFNVTDTGDVGYVASSSLAGSRLNTNLRDTAASISVLTSEFLSDIGATNLSEAMQYSNNSQPDLVDTTTIGTAPNDNSTFANFATFRIRGASATVTRNYFTWRLPVDTYNIDRVEESRGPNSILFGIGAPGGIVNASTKQAKFGQNFRHAAAQVGSYGSYRGSFDVNQSAFDKKLAVRLNAVYDHTGSFRQHVFSNNRRIDLAATYNITPTTQLRAEYETGDVNEVTARTLNAYDGVTTWLARGSPTFAAPVTAAATLAANGLNNYGATRRITFVGNSGRLIQADNQLLTIGTGNAIDDPKLADFTVNTGGPGQQRHAYFEAVSFFLTQRLPANTFAELAYNHQYNAMKSYLAAESSSEGAQLRADPNQFLSDGSRNPYVGQQMFEGGWGLYTINGWSDDTRLTLSTERDFGKWGNYRIAALGEYEMRVTQNFPMREFWEGHPFNSTPENAVNMVYRRNYMTLGDWASYYYNSPSQYGLIRNMPDPSRPGQTLSSKFSPSSANQKESPNYQRTVLIGGQARYFSNRLVLGAGARLDKLKITDRQDVRDPVTSEYKVDYANAIDYFYSGHTYTAGAVGHITQWLGVFYNVSNNFSLPNATARVLPDATPAPNPVGNGSDYGLMFDLFGDRVHARITKYQNDVEKLTAGFAGGADSLTPLTQTVLDALVNSRQITEAEATPRRKFSNTGLTDRTTNGYEFMLTANPTRNWRLQANYSYTNGYQSAIARDVTAWANEALPYFRSFNTSIVTSSQNRTIKQVLDDWEAQYKNVISFEGVGLPGNRQHKVNLYSAYSFTEGMLKGFSVGGGYQHQSKNLIGLSPAKEPQYGNSYWLADAMVNYRFRRLFYMKNLRLQLNIKNLFDYDKPLVTRVRDDGSLFRWAIVEPRTWRLSANLDF